MSDCIFVILTDLLTSLSFSGSYCPALLFSDSAASCVCRSVSSFVVSVCISIPSYSSLSELLSSYASSSSPVSLRVVCKYVSYSCTTNPQSSSSLILTSCSTIGWFSSTSGTISFDSSWTGCVGTLLEQRSLQFCTTFFFIKRLDVIERARRPASMYDIESWKEHSSAAPLLCT